MAEDTLTNTTIETIERFSAALNQRDADAVMALMTGDCVFENTYPAPDGRRYQGQQAVRAFWEEFFRSSPYAHFSTEEIIALADRCVVRWLYSWQDAEGKSGHVRGVDVFRVRDGRVAEKLAYVKG